MHVAKGTCRFRSVVLQDEEIGVLVLCQFGQVTCIGQWNHNMLKDSCEFADTAQTSPDHLNQRVVAQVLSLINLQLVICEDLRR